VRVFVVIDFQVQMRLIL